jgi:biotin carboxylase
VPNIITTVATYEELLGAAGQAGLGADLVVQTAYGDSGKTTFFIASEQDWSRHDDDVADAQVKVMKRINNRPVAVEAVLTRSGTVVGPFMSELTGHPELTPYRGGWCGNEMFPDVLSKELRAKAGSLVRRLGDRLGQEGYRGFFEVDVLVDVDDGDIYLGELNPRISGASAITHVTAGAYADVPLFLFHLLEFMGVDFDLDIDDVNARWERLAAEDLWSQMVLKETGSTVEHIDAAPQTGQYVIDDTGALVFRRAALDWHQLQNESEAFFLRIYGPGDYRWKGADLGVMVTKGRLEVSSPRRSASLTIRARHLIDSIRGRYVGTPLSEPLPLPPPSSSSKPF